MIAAIYPYDLMRCKSLRCINAMHHCTAKANRPQTAGHDEDWSSVSSSLWEKERDVWMCTIILDNNDDDNNQQQQPMATMSKTRRHGKREGSFAIRLDIDGIIGASTFAFVHRHRAISIPTSEWRGA
mmetsp:Transcript_22633/g.64084  ORF Transcript_22633/g.64084 Transcript_22633/m.64084 type:complete len:127 (+) Transcript_22633:3-383(+)